MITAKTPWVQFMGDVPAHLEYDECTMYEALAQIESRYPNAVAFDFMGKSTTYKEMIINIRHCARALKAMGIKRGDCVTIALPNCPQAIYMFYGINLLGGVANMVHPLSAEKEIEFYIRESDSVAAITLDQFADKFREIASIKCLIVADIADALSPFMRVGYRISQGRKKKLLSKCPTILWREFWRKGKKDPNLNSCTNARDSAVILYSGGTTGMTKGILLSNYNFNALAQQVAATNPMFCPGDRMLAAMPIFHGFGLGVCIHSMLYNGGRCVLVPRFTPKTYAKDLVRYKCNYIAGVPTLFEALLRLPNMKNADLSCLKGVFSGGDTLSVELKKKLDEFLQTHRAPVLVREGYGTTETVTACCLTPAHMHKEGSIGIPFPDTYIKIVEPGTDRELPYGQEGEILLAGPTVMIGYMNHPEETAQTLQAHDDGLTWVYTGDLGLMDDQGFVYFKGRAKRMIVTSGYNVYPAQLENIIDAHKYVQMSCVIGMPDAYKMQKIKAFVKLKDGILPEDTVKQEILAHCRKHIAKYALPADIEFRENLPQTLVGKVAYRQLEEEELKNA